MKKMFSLHPHIHRKYEFIFVFSKNQSLFFWQDFYLSKLNKIWQEFMMMATKNLWHELVDIERYHIFIIMPKKLTNIFGYFFYLSSLLNHVDINDSMFRAEYILILFLEKPSLQIFLLWYDFELFLPGSIGLQVLIEDVNEEVHPKRVRVVDNKVFKFITNFLF